MTVADTKQGLRIVQVSPYSLDQVSGINTLIDLLAAELRNAGITCVILRPFSANKRVSADSVTLSLRSKVGRNLELAIRTFKFLITRRSTFDVVHVHQPHLQTLAALIAAKVLRVPAVITFHVRVPTHSKTQALRSAAIAKAVCALAGASVAVSRGTAADFDLKNPSVIPNGVVPPPRSGNPRSSANQGPLVLVFAGRLTRSKGIYTLLEALGLASKRLDVRLVTFGPIDEAAEYSRMKREVGVESIVDDRGYDAGWKSSLSIGQVFILPSLYEGLPMSMLEAMANGLPVLSTPVGGIGEAVIENETGLFVPVGDAPRLADAICWFGKNREEVTRMGLLARTVIETRFSAAAMAKSYLDLYLNLAHRRD